MRLDLQAEARLSKSAGSDTGLAFSLFAPPVLPPAPQASPALPPPSRSGSSHHTSSCCSPRHTLATGNIDAVQLSAKISIYTVFNSRWRGLEPTLSHHYPIPSQDNCTIHAPSVHLAPKVPLVRVKEGILSRSLLPTLPSTCSHRC